MRRSRLAFGMSRISLVSTRRSLGRLEVLRSIARYGSRTMFDQATKLCASKPSAKSGQRQLASVGVPGLKRPRVWISESGAAAASNQKLNSVAQRRALALAFSACEEVPQVTVPVA